MIPSMRALDWAAGGWSTPPVSAVRDGSDLLVTAVEGSDAWRHTAYGFVHEDEHALLAPFAEGGAVEVEFTAGFSAQFDQAGLFLAAGPEHWIKAGVELSDGVPSVGAVVTEGRSDWSLGAVPEWSAQRIVVRASWSHGAVTVRAGIVGGALRLVRVAPFAPPGPVAAGPYTCAPTRAGLTVRFHAWRMGAADGTLH